MLNLTSLRRTSASLDGETLICAMRSGVFRISPEQSTNTAKEFANEINVFESIECVFSAFEAVANLDVSEDPVYGPLKENVRVATLPAPLEFVNFFNELVKGFVNDFNAFSDPCVLVNQRFKSTAAGLMALACALDQPTALAALTQAIPDAVHEALPSMFAGACNASPLANLTLSALQGGWCRFLPPFFAIHYSANACLDAFVAAGWRASDPLGFRPEDAQPSLRFIDVVTEEAMLFQPHTLAKVMGLMKKADGTWPEDDKDTLYRLALDRLDTSESLSCGYVSGLMACGIYELDLARSLRAAAGHGAVELFDHYGHCIPWRELAGKHGEIPLMIHIMGTAGHGCAGDCEPMALKVLAMAERDGAAKLIDLKTMPRGGVYFLNQVVASNMAGVLHHYLEEGLDPMAPIFSGEKSLLDLVNAHAPSDESGHQKVTHLVRAFIARRRAFALLDEMQCEQAH